MQTKRILIANRGEIACRLIRTYRLFPLPPSTSTIETVAIYTASEANALHVSLADVSHQLAGEGARAYLDAEAIVSAAVAQRCWGVAPGYGFLAEDAGFAGLCEQRGLVFIGPTSGQLEGLGDKLAARALAGRLGAPVLPGTSGSLSDIVGFAQGLERGAGYASSPSPPRPL